MDTKKVFPNIKTVPHTPNLICYHGMCPDGFGAAFSAWKSLGDNATYLPCSYGDSAPDVEGKHVAVFDFCWSKPVLQEIKAKSASFVLLDHHASAMKENQDEEHCYFDMSKSGAYLAWEFFHPDSAVPKLIQYVQDQDIWTWKMPFSKEFNIAQSMRPFEFAAWDPLLLDENVDAQIESGKVLLSYQQTLVARVAEKAVQVMWSGKRVYVANSCLFASEVGNVLALREDCDFALIYHYNLPKKAYEISLRSADDVNNVSLVAKQFGGGGHVRASGMSWDGPTLASLFETTLTLLHASQ